MSWNQKARSFVSEMSRWARTSAAPSTFCQARQGGSLGTCGSRRRREWPICRFPGEVRRSRSRRRVTWCAVRCGATFPTLLDRRSGVPDARLGRARRAVRCDGRAPPGAGHRVVMLDAPAHGDSYYGPSGPRRTNGLEFAKALDAAFCRFGPAEAVIAHSLGTIATYLALRFGWLGTTRLVLIAPMVESQSLFDQFQTVLGFGERTRRAFDRSILDWVGIPVAEFEHASRQATSTRCPRWSSPTAATARRRTTTSWTSRSRSARRSSRRRASGTGRSSATGRSSRMSSTSYRVGGSRAAMCRASPTGRPSHDLWVVVAR